jgi:phosphoglycolate phosphatase-like HAD superfamily hydrolase
MGGSVPLATKTVTFGIRYLPVGSSTVTWTVVVHPPPSPPELEPELDPEPPPLLDPELDPEPPPLELDPDPPLLELDPPSPGPLPSPPPLLPQARNTAHTNPKPTPRNRIRPTYRFFSPSTIVGFAVLPWMRIRPFIAALSLTAGAFSCHSAAPANVPAATPRALDPSLPGWLPQNRARLDALLAARGSSSSGYDPAHRPVATFDWDNTMMRNDIGDATMAWMLRHDLILQPPARDWSVTSPALTAAARSALSSACDSAGEPGHPLATRENVACTDALYAIYDDGKTPAGAPAWTRTITLTTNEGYAWLARLLAGHTAAEIAAFTHDAYVEASQAPVGATLTLGSHAGVTAYVRIYPTMHDLVGALQSNGFDVWIVSASPQLVSEVVAHEVGIAPDHVVGIRSVPGADGRLGYALEPCGDAPPGSVITFNQGKRCFINRVIFHQPRSAQLAKADAAHRQVFAAGDSDTDVAFVQDATDLKLVIDRNRVQLMCNAYSNPGGRWLVQPMFIEPLPPRTEPYPCASALDAAGQPLVDEDGRPMRDQRP